LSTTSTISWDKPAKNNTRVELLNTGQRSVKTALDLPGQQMLSVTTALQLGVVNLRTRNIWVEEVSSVADEIEKRATLVAKRVKGADWVARPYLHRGPLELLDLRPLLGASPLDFAFIDLCAGLNPWRLRWMRQQLVPALRGGSSVAITVLKNRSSFMAKMRKEVLHDQDKLLGDSMRKLDKVTNKPSVHAGAIFSMVRLALAPLPVMVRVAVNYSHAGIGGSCFVGLQLAIQDGQQTFDPRLESRFQRVIDPGVSYLQTIFERAQNNVDRDRGKRLSGD